MDQSNPCASPDKSLSGPSLSNEKSVETSRRNEQSPRHQATVGRKSSGMSSPSSLERNGDGRLSPILVSRRDDIRHNQDYNHTVFPKFGDWDESDPRTADGLTHKFSMARRVSSRSRQAFKQRTLPDFIHNPNPTSTKIISSYKKGRWFPQSWKHYICLGLGKTN